MVWLLLSFIGLIFIVASIKYYDKENQDIQNRKRRKWVFAFYLLLAVASESSLLYLGLLLFLFGILMAIGTL